MSLESCAPADAKDENRCLHKREGGFQQEGAYRVPAMLRWPGKIKPGEVSNEIVAHLDMLPTLLAVAGDTEVKDKLLKGCTIGDMPGASGVLPMPMSAMGHEQTRFLQAWYFGSQHLSGH
jgi:arylsulfatase A-like enzyme